MTTMSHNKPSSANLAYKQCKDSNTGTANEDMDTHLESKKASSLSQTKPHSHDFNNHHIQTITDPSQFQLVLYEPNRRILPIFHEKSRIFEFAGKQWTILQQWDEIGVASVVWEAVSDT